MSNHPSALIIFLSGPLLPCYLNPIFLPSPF
jgi:hypothetical protein